MNSGAPAAQLYAASGAARTLSSTATISGDPYAGMPFDDETKRQMSLLSTRNATSPTILDEMNRAPENFTALRNAAFPGGHHLHHTQSPAIAAETAAFLAG